MKQGAASFRSCTMQARLVVTKPEGSANGTNQVPCLGLGMGNLLCTINNAFCSTGIKLSKIYSLRENKDVKFLVTVTSAECSMYLRIRLPQHEVATKHLFLSLLNLKAFHCEVIQREINSEYPLLGQPYFAFPTPGLNDFFFFF